MRLTHITHVAISCFALCACMSIQSPPTAVSKSNMGTSATPAKAKNVILFIGDGMGISTITAARIYDGQSRGETGEENLLSFEHFPNVALVKTYNSNQQVPDSAGTATAINTGQKTRAGVIGVGPDVSRGNCEEAQIAPLPNIALQLYKAGKAIGIVSNMRITHATPAAVYAHAPERNWEADSDIPDQELAKGCTDIAAQLMDFPFDIALGGGRERFLGSQKGGKRRGLNVDLLAKWKARTNGEVIGTKAELDRQSGKPGPLIGLFAQSNMAFMQERPTDTTEPTLSEMTAAAIDKVAVDPDGYFLMIEGGNIDIGHHEGRADIALSETQEFARAVSVALQKVDLSNTLILVTADHSHVFTIAGYARRGSPILGLAMGVDDRGEPTGKPILATDGKPYSILGYQNGPGAVRKSPRPAPTNNPHEKKQAVVPTGSVFNNGHRLSETHGGEDVALYATGPGSKYARGVIEQNRIYHIIMQALELDK